MERVKILEMQPGRTVRRKGSGTCAQPSMEQERSVCAPAVGGRGLAGSWCPVGGEADKCSPRNGPCAQRKSAQVVVAMTGQDNITGPSEGPVAGRASRDPGRRRGRGPCAPTRGGRLWSRFGHERLDGSPTGWQPGMRVIDYPVERRVQENCMHGSIGGRQETTLSRLRRATAGASRLPDHSRAYAFVQR